MKVPRLTRLLNRYIKPEFAGYRQSGRILYKEPLEYVLRGYSFGSGFHTDTLYVHVFMQPLYIPREYHHYTFGDRIAGVDVEDDNPVPVMEEVLRAMKDAEPHVDRFRSPMDIANDEWYFQGQDERYLELRGYSLVLTGDYEEAETCLQALRVELSQQIRKRPDATWLPEVDDRAARLLEAVRRNPPLAIAMQNEWTEYTKRNLKLP
jgi:hypothetical protein